MSGSVGPRGNSEAVGTPPPTYIHLIRSFVEWCDLTGEPCDPTTEQTVLRFLAVHPKWRASTVEQAVAAIRWIERSHGHSHDDWDRVPLYVKAVRRENGAPQPRADALDPRVVAAAALKLAPAEELQSPAIRQVGERFRREFQLSGVDREGWLRATTKSQRRNWMMLSYFLLGISTARRHAELSRLRLGDVSRFDGGYSFTLSEHKGNLIAARKGGKTSELTFHVDHLSDTDTECPPHCPACAVERQFISRRANGATNSSPLFPAFRSEKALNQRAGRDIVIQCLRAGGLTEAEAGTQTMRVTGATYAHQAGLSPQEIADQVTHHRTPDGAARYIRRVDPTIGDASLPLMGPA